MKVIYDPKTDTLSVILKEPAGEQPGQRAVGAVSHRE